MLPTQNSEEPKNINILCKERVIVSLKSYQSIGSLIKIRPSLFCAMFCIRPDP